MIYDHCNFSDTAGALLELQELLEVTLKGDNLRAFLKDWEHVLAGISPAHTDAVMETLFRMQLAKSAAMRDIMAYYNRLDIGHADKTYLFPYVGTKTF
jgi:hypothetical protein